MADRPPDDAIGRIRRLRGVRWVWRGDAPPEVKAQAGMGVVAQDVEKVFPELVTTDDRGLRQVDYAGLIAPVIEAIKELDDRLRVIEGRDGRGSPTDS